MVPKSEHEAQLAENISVSWIYCLTKLFSHVESSSGSLDCRTLDRIHLKPRMHRSVCGFHSPELGGSCLVRHMRNWAECSNLAVSCANEYCGIFLQNCWAVRYRFPSFWSHGRNQVGNEILPWYYTYKVMTYICIGTLGLSLRYHLKKDSRSPYISSSDW